MSTTQVQSRSIHAKANTGWQRLEAERDPLRVPIDGLVLTLVFVLPACTAGSTRRGWCSWPAFRNSRR